jgi:hypothetical protein
MNNGTTTISHRVTAGRFQPADLRRWRQRPSCGRIKLDRFADSGGRRIAVISGTTTESALKRLGVIGAQSGLVR